jgi:O-antigen/teichoic acid export membrane protein
VRTFSTSLFKRVLSVKNRNGFWALTDQGAVSLGTFLTNVVLARSLPPAEYGIFALACGLIYFLNSLHSAVVTVPLISRGACATENEIRRLAAGALVLTTPLILPQAAVICIATWAVGRPGLIPWVIAVLVFWQFQEIIRRTFMARLRHREAILGDIVSYLGQAVIVWTFAARQDISAEKAFAVMAFTSGAAGLLQMIQHGLKWAPPTEIRRLAGVFWELGRWVLMTNFIGVFIFQAYPWMLAFFYSAAASAELQAAGNILGVSNPIFLGIGSLIYPAVVRTNGERGNREATKVGFGYALQGGMLLLPFYLILILWPQWALQLFYGANSPYLGLTGVLRLFVLCYSIGYLSNFMMTILNGLEKMKVAFFSQLAGAITTMVVGAPLAAWGGVTGAAAGGGLTSLAQLMVSGFYLRNAHKSYSGVDPSVTVRGASAT